MELDGHIVEFVDSGALRLGYVRKREQRKIQVIDKRGRESSVPASRVVVVHGPAEEADFPMTADEIMERVKFRSDQIDVELLWESVRSRNEELSPDTLAEVFFGETSPEAESAIFRELERDTLFFKRKAARFVPRSEEQVATERRRLAREEVKERFRAKANVLFREALRGETSLPEDSESQEIAERLEKWLRYGERDEIGSILEKVTGATRARETAYDLLLAWGRVDPSEDRFLLSRGIPTQFSPNVIQACGRLEAYSESKLRETISNVSLTIDDEETSEVDDAITIASEPDRTIVGVHIADVSFFVAKDDALDREASRRSATIYLPNITVTMFPPRLAEDLASLVQDRLRPTFTIEAKFDRNDRLVDFRIFRGALRVTKRMGYAEADLAIRAGDTALTQLDRIATRLHQDRLNDGAQTYRRPEIKVRVKNGEISVRRIAADTPARLVVSELMILANRLAAEHAAAAGVPIIFRTQESPDTPAPDTEGLAEAVRFELLRKRFKRSRLSLSRSPHAGLGLTAYTQMSSPIRRYADLITQRQFAAAIEGRPLPYAREELLGVITDAEAAEVAIRNLEQASTTYWILRHLASMESGTIFRAVVLDAKGRVELTDYQIRGRIPEEKEWRPGDEVRLTIESVNASRGEIQFRVS